MGLSGNDERSIIPICPHCKRVPKTHYTMGINGEPYIWVMFGFETPKQSRWKNFDENKIVRFNYVFCADCRKFFEKEDNLRFFNEVLTYILRLEIEYVDAEEDYNEWER
jgi:hypothetical protein